MEKIKGKFLETITLEDGSIKTRVVEGDISLKDILLYSLTEDGKKINLLLKRTSDEGKIEITETTIGLADYSNEVMDAIIKEMPEILGLLETRDKGIRIMYEGSRYFLATSNLESRVEKIIAEQRDKRPNENYNPEKQNYPTVSEAIEIVTKRRKKGLVSIIAEILAKKGRPLTDKEIDMELRKLGLGVAAFAAAATTGCAGYNIEISISPNSTPTPYVTAAPTASPDPTIQTTSTPEVAPISVIKEPGVIYSWDPDNPNEAAEMGKAFYNQSMNCSDLAQLNSILTESRAREFISFLGDRYPDDMKAITEIDPAFGELDNILNVVRFYVIGATEPGATVLDISEFVPNSKERELVKNVFLMGSELVKKSVGEPINGKIVNSEGEKNFHREYIDTVNKFLHFEVDTMNSNEYGNANDMIKFIIMTYFDWINGSLIPWWATIDRLSFPEIRENDNRVLYFEDRSKDGYIWYAVPGKDVWRSVFQPSDAKTCKPLGDPITFDEMEALEESNPNIQRQGIMPEVEIRVRNIIDSLRSRVYVVISQLTPAPVKKY